MESQIVREAQERVQFVAAVYDYHATHRESPLGIWMPQTRHWVGDIFDTKFGRIYLSVKDKGIFDPYVYDAQKGLDLIDPRLVEYDFRYPCAVHEPTPIDEPPADPPKECDRKTLPNSFFEQDGQWHQMRAYPMRSNALLEDKQLQTDIALVRQLGDLTAYSPIENAGFLNLLSDKGTDLPPVIPVSSYWVYSDGLLGEGYMLKTSSGWREVYARRHSGYTGINQECCILSRKKGMGEPRIATGAALPIKDIKILWSYVLERNVLPYLTSGKEGKEDRERVVIHTSDPVEQFRIASFCTTAKGDTNLVVGDAMPDQKDKWPNGRAVLFPIDVQERPDTQKVIKILVSAGHYAKFDFRGDLEEIEEKVDPSRYVGFLKENLEQPIVPEFRRNSQLRVEVIL